MIFVRFCAFNSDRSRGFSISNILLHMEINMIIFVVKFSLKLKISNILLRIVLLFKKLQFIFGLVKNCLEGDFL